jgi:Fe2+ or Zn2+ uptake regulation protein
VFQSAVYLCLNKHNPVYISDIYEILSKKNPSITKEQIVNTLNLVYKMGELMQIGEGDNAAFNFFSYLDNAKKILLPDETIIYAKDAEVKNEWEAAIYPQIQLKFPLESHRFQKASF